MRDPEQPMAVDEITSLAHELRSLIQTRTCCPAHAGVVLMLVCAGFALDDADYDNHLAAKRFSESAKSLTSDLKAGRIKMARHLDA